MDGPAGVKAAARRRAKKARRGHGWPGGRKGGRMPRKKQPAGAMDGPAGVKAAGCRAKKARRGHGWPGGREVSGGDRIRTCDLEVMSLASYRAAPPRDMFYYLIRLGGRLQNRR